jgi:hypothetical protein
MKNNQKGTNHTLLILQMEQPALLGTLCKQWILRVLQMSQEDKCHKSPRQGLQQRFLQDTVSMRQLTYFRTSGCMFRGDMAGKRRIRLKNS